MITCFAGSNKYDFVPLNKIIILPYGANVYSFNSLKICCIFVNMQYIIIFRIRKYFV